MYTIGELSKHTGVTVRTLDYYDEIHLISPSSKTDGGHRLYSDDDVLKLERVLAMKYMGFSLGHIKNILEQPSTTWQESIQEQLDYVRREQERLQTLEEALLGVSYSIDFEGEANWSVIFQIIQLYQQDSSNILQPYHEYLNEDDIKKITNMNPAQMKEEDVREWMQVIRTIKQNLHLPPDSKEAWQLVERWSKQAEKMFSNDEQLLGDMWEALQHLTDDIAFYPMNQEVVHFLKQVFIAYENESENDS
ncbi:MerR family transcriptional regulator [Virgibacillus sp. NKC19-3]|uniref:MerR family transcriptional regulator n=1 Tax=Virgibacillus saliphilus TaxID=2831674 RepID=UPI001C9AA8A8|nr:MerR family transcriptional regulator [Virgibacillus sp. NKC19-3]MBY7142535.1 MerR family transcriptional regulator [Virgibacillus sp. NKC19-3]